MANNITITSELAGAVMTLLRLGTFPVQYAQIKDVEAALLASVEAAGIPIEEVPAEEAIRDNALDGADDNNLSVGGTD